MADSIQALGAFNGNLVVVEGHEHGGDGLDPFILVVAAQSQDGVDLRLHVLEGLLAEADEGVQQLELDARVHRHKLRLGMLQDLGREEGGYLF